jgi:hypothetical protein
MNRQAVLAAFDQQLRRHPEPDTPDGHIEHDDSVVRIVPVGDGWTGVTWCDLDHESADAVIAAQISRFAQLHRPWEWKHYSYDQPPDLPDRLLAAGFTPEPAEALLVAEIADLTLDVPPPSGVELHPVTDEQDVEALVSVHDQVFGEDASALGRTLLAALARQPPTAPPGYPGVGQRLPLPPGRRLPRQPTDSPATRLRRACHHHPIHAPRRSRLTSQIVDPPTDELDRSRPPPDCGQPLFLRWCPFSTSVTVGADREQVGCRAV